MSYIYQGAGKGYTVQVLTSAAVIKNFQLDQRQTIKQLQFQISVAVSTSSSVVLAFKYYPVMGSSANAVTLGTLTIPTGAAAGKVYYKNITPYVANMGGEIVAEVTTVASSAGSGNAAYVFEECAEVEANESALVASA